MKIKNLLKLLVLSTILSITVSAMEELGTAKTKSVFSAAERNEQYRKKTGNRFRKQEIINDRFMVAAATGNFRLVNDFLKQNVIDQNTINIVFYNATIASNLPVVQILLNLNELKPSKDIMNLAFRELLHLPVPHRDEHIANRSFVFELISNRDCSNSELSRATSNFGNLARVSFLLTLPGEAIPGHEAIVSAYRDVISRRGADRRIAARLTFIMPTARLTERVARA